MSKRLALSQQKVIIPTFRVAPAIRAVLEKEADSRTVPVSLSLICQEAILEYIAEHGLFDKFGVTPPTPPVRE